MMRIAVVGGGLCGMTIAWNAVKAGHAVTIFEGAQRCGGLAAPWQIGGVTWDRHYHVTLYSDTELRGLLDELDLSSGMRWVQTRTGFYVDGKMYPFSGLPDYLRFPPLGLVDKAMLGRTILQASRLKDWRRLERITAVDWLTQQSGKRTVERIWLPLLRAKLGPFATRASAAFIWAIIARMYAARNTGLKREMFGYMHGGYDRTLSRFEERLQQAGVEILTSCPVESVERDGGGGVRVASGGGVRSFDKGVITLAPPVAAKLCSSLNRSERERCSGVEYQGIICASLLLDSPLTPYYITNIADASIPFTAVIEMTALVDRSEFGGRSLIYLPKYVPVGDPAFAASDAEIEDRFLRALERMHPSFRRKNVRAFQVSRVPYVFPVPTLGYSDRLPPVKTSVPGVYLASSANIVNGTLNVNETVKLANAVSPAILEERETALQAAV